MKQPKAGKPRSPCDGPECAWNGTGVEKGEIRAPKICTKTYREDRLNWSPIFSLWWEDFTSNPADCKCWLASPAPDIVGHDILKWNPRRKQKRLHFQEELLHYNTIYIYILYINENILSHGEWIQLYVEMFSWISFLDSRPTHFMHRSGAPFYPQIGHLYTGPPQFFAIFTNARLCIRRLVTPTISHQRIDWKKRKEKSDGTLEFPLPALITWHTVTGFASWCAK